MNGYEIMAASYRQMVKQGRIDKETADKEIRIYDFLATCDTEDICRMVDSSAFNDIIKAFVETAVKNADIDEDAGKKVVAQLHNGKLQKIGDQSCSVKHVKFPPKGSTGMRFTLEHVLLIGEKRKGHSKNPRNCGRKSGVQPVRHVHRIEQRRRQHLEDQRHQRCQSAHQNIHPHRFVGVPKLLQRFRQTADDPCNHFFHGKSPFFNKFIRFS